MIEDGVFIATRPRGLGHQRGGGDWSPSPPRGSPSGAILGPMAEPLYGMHGRIVARPGHGGELAAILLEAAAGLQVDPECLLYVVNRAANDPDSVWVTEAWTSRDAHAASLENPGARDLIARARPIIASFEDRAELRPEGGKGLPAQSS
jgi:quinol monooxygenase YgiN